MRFKGIPEGVNYLSFNIAKTLINKGLSVIARNEVSLPPHFHEGRLCESRGSNLVFLYLLVIPAKSSPSESEHNRDVDDKAKGSPSPVNNDPARTFFPVYLRT